MQVDPNEWESQPDYQESKHFVQFFKVVNDLAERGVALIQKFNWSLHAMENRSNVYDKSLRTIEKNVWHQLSPQQLMPSYSQ